MTSFSDSSISPSEGDLTHMSSLLDGTPHASPYRLSKLKSGFNFENSISADSAETERTIKADRAGESSWIDGMDIPVSLSAKKKSKELTSLFRFSSPHSIIIR